MTENGKKDTKMDKEHTNSSQEINTKDSGIKTKEMEQEFIFGKMDLSTMVSGNTQKWTARVPSTLLMGLLSKVNLKTMNM